MRILPSQSRFNIMLGRLGAVCPLLHGAAGYYRFLARGISVAQSNDQSGHGLEESRRMVSTPGLGAFPFRAVRTEACPRQPPNTALQSDQLDLPSI